MASTALSNDEIETRYCWYVDEVLNWHRLEATAALYVAADAVSRGDGITVGRAGARDFVGRLVHAFPDLHLTIDALAGTFVGVPPTGRRVRRSAFGCIAPGTDGHASWPMTTRYAASR